MAVARLMGLVASGQASSRADLARLLGWAPSTVSARVQELLDGGLLRESGAGQSRGGRRPRLLTVREHAGVVLAADLGGHHARLAAIDVAGTPLVVRDLAIDIASGAQPLLEQIADALADVHQELDGGEPLMAVAMGLPGPVDADRGIVTGPSRMPGWNGFPVRDWLVERFAVPVVLDNDANLMALGEMLVRGPALRDFVLVKAGTGIGAAAVGGGLLHRGARGAAGDISHVQVPAAGDAPCSCGNHGCLETVASGASLVQLLSTQGVAVQNASDLVRLAADGDPPVTTHLRFAGRQLGEVLATVLNFFNPQAVILGGTLATIDPFVAAIRSVLYERCLPLVTQDLEISVTTAGPNAGLLGLGVLALEEGLSHVSEASASNVDGGRPTGSETRPQKPARNEGAA